ncbi:MAG: VOC family protein [Bacteroidales bacterium]
MKTTAITLAASLILLPHLCGQSPLLERLSPLTGNWQGHGSGFGNDQSEITSSFTWVMDGQYMEIRNESFFEPTLSNPVGEHHTDHGFISFDASREKLIYRQFNNEGYVNRYILQDSLSDDSLLIFETEAIENFAPGGKARFTIHLISNTTMETIFDVSLPGSEYACFGKNVLTKNHIVAMNEQEPRVTGVGGIFFRTSDPEKTKQWYSENLGLATNEYGSVFEFRNAHRPEEVNYLSWSPFEQGTDYFQPSEKEFMINYRVNDLVGLEKKLRENGVTIVDEIEEYSYGKFLHIMDGDGNKIELWEPIDHVLTEMGGTTTK